MLLYKGTRYRLIFKLAPTLTSIHQFRGVIELVSKNAGMTLIDLSSTKASISYLPPRDVNVLVGQPMVLMEDVKDPSKSSSAILTNVVPEAYPVRTMTLRFPNPPV